MSNLLFLPYFLFASFFFNGASNYYEETLIDECGIEGIYEAIYPDFGVKVFTDDDELVDPQYILVPASMDDGRYKVSVSRETDDLYRLDGTKYFIVTNYCYEYVYLEDAVMEIVNRSGFTFGTIYFED